MKKILICMMLYAIILLRANNKSANDEKNENIIIVGHKRGTTTEGYIHIPQEHVVQEMQKLTYPIDVILQPDSLQDEELH